MPQICNMGKRLYFPSEGRHAEDFFARKNPTASAMSKPAILGTRGQQHVALLLQGILGTK
jgi:hypothetical protein